MATRCSDPDDPNDRMPLLAATNHCARVSRGDCLGFEIGSRKSEETDPRVLSLNEKSSSSASRRRFFCNQAPPVSEAMGAFNGSHTRCDNVEHLSAAGRDGRQQGQRGARLPSFLTDGALADLTVWRFDRRMAARGRLRPDALHK